MSHSVFRNAVAATVMSQDGLLPLTKTVQRLVSVMVDLQIRLQEHKITIIMLFLTKASSCSLFFPLLPKKVSRMFVSPVCRVAWSVSDVGKKKDEAYRQKQAVVLGKAVEKPFSSISSVFQAWCDLKLCYNPFRRKQMLLLPSHTYTCKNPPWRLPQGSRQIFHLKRGPYGEPFLWLLRHARFT